MPDHMCIETWEDRMSGSRGREDELWARGLVSESASTFVTKRRRTKARSPPVARRKLCMCRMPQERACRPG